MFSVRCRPDNGDFIFQLFKYTIVVYSKQLKKERKRLIQWTIREGREREGKKVVIVTTPNVHINTYIDEILRTIRREEVWWWWWWWSRFKYRNCIRVGHEIQLSEDRAGEVIEEDVCFCLKVEQKKERKVSRYLSTLNVDALTCERYH